MNENTENKIAEDGNRGLARVKKILKRVGWVLLVVLVVMWAIGFFAPEFTEAIPERTTSWLQGKIEARKQSVLDAEIDKIREKYENDFDGGKTPEETLELFIEALKAGDIEKASKYYELSVQGQQLGELKKELQKERSLKTSTDYIIEVYKKGVKKCGNDENGDWCMFKYIYTETATTTYKINGTSDEIIVPAGEKTTESVSLGLNKYTNVWKISQ